MSKNPHAVALGRLGGLATKGVSTPKKAAAARLNGRKGAKMLRDDVSIARGIGPDCARQMGMN